MDVQRSTSEEQYREVQIETSTTLDLLQLAYSGILDCLNKAVDSVESTGESPQKSYDVFNEQLSKAQQIVSALDDGLDENQGEIADTLASFYLFIRKKLIESNMEKSLDGVKEVMVIVEHVRGYWKQQSPSDVSSSTPTDSQPSIDKVN